MICDHAGLLATAQLAAVSSPVVQRHTPSNRKARVRGVWCEAFAPQIPKSRSEAPPFVPLHHHTRGHGMTHTLSARRSTSITTPPLIMMYDNARLLATVQLTVVPSPVVQRHTPWNRRMNACGVWCEAFAPQAAKSQGEAPQCVPLHNRTRAVK